MTRFSLLGSSSGRNAGDAALIRSIIEGIRREIPDAHFEIPTIAPAFLRAAYPADLVTPIPILPWNLSVKFFGLPVFRSVRRCDASVVFDAVLFDRSLWNPLFNYLSTLRFALPYARRHGRRVVFYNVGVGPIATPAGRRFLRETFAAGDLFTIRDPESFALAQDVGLPEGRPALLTADAALNHPVSSASSIDPVLASLDLPAGRPLVGFNVNAYLDTWAPERSGDLDEARFRKVMAAVADRMVERWNATVVFFVTQHMDSQITQKVRGSMRHRDHTRTVSNRTLAPEVLQGLMGRMELFFGMRFHSLLLAVSQHTPVVGLVYQGKVTSLFLQIEQPAAALSFARFDLESMWPTLERMWESRAEERARLGPIVARLRSQADQAAVRTAELLRAS